MSNSIPALLLLEDGTIFNGLSIGKKGTVTGEIAFNTGMTGYQEVFTDPSYYGQILVMNTVHIGNYGVHNTEVESDSIKISGLITKKFSDEYSRTSASGSLEDLLCQNNVVGISDIDTRSLVRHIRDKGAMNAIISSENKTHEELSGLLSETPSMQGLELSSKVTTHEAYESGDVNSKSRVALLDLGVKRSIVSCLTDRDCFKRQLLSFFLTAILLFDIIDAASNPALVAPSSPIARVPTGIPFGICAIDSKLSNPFNFLLSIGTPKTGTLVKAAIIPGK